MVKANDCSQFPTFSLPTTRVHVPMHVYTRLMHTNETWSKVMLSTSYFRTVMGRSDLRRTFRSGDEYMTVAVTTRLAPTKKDIVG
jgi:hypothetical protein